MVKSRHIPGTPSGAWDMREMFEALVNNVLVDRWKKVNALPNIYNAASWE